MVGTGGHKSTIAMAGEVDGDGNPETFFMSLDQKSNNLRRIQIDRILSLT